VFFFKVGAPRVSSDMSYESLLGHLEWTSKVQLLSARELRRGIMSARSTFHKSSCTAERLSAPALVVGEGVSVAPDFPFIVRNQPNIVLHDVSV
jgi:hypothetical protein